MISHHMDWMKYSIDISKRGSPLQLRVGAVLISELNELICSSYTGETDKSSWLSILLRKIRRSNVTKAQCLYVTINTLSEGVFDLVELLKEIHINEVFIGLPDPAVTCYLDDDLAIKSDFVYRYPDELQCEIIKLNESLFLNSKQCIKYSPYYYENRIGSLVIAKLQSSGLNISIDELNANKQPSALASIISDRYEIDYSAALSIVSKAISDAFDSKYAMYNYADDSRSLSSDWKECFKSICEHLFTTSISNIRVLNVGVGGGHEAIELFSNCMHVTFVDIAQGGLDSIKKHMPFAETVLSCATDLVSIPDSSYDLYVSLRSYNSSFFNIKKAITEARRVLKPNAAIILSVANGFLCPELNSIILGLIIPETEFVDIYRGMNTIRLMHREFAELGFRCIQVFLTDTEIFISAIAS